MLQIQFDWYIVANMLPIEHVTELVRYRESMLLVQVPGQTG